MKFILDIYDGIYASIVYTPWYICNTSICYTMVLPFHEFKLFFSIKKIYSGNTMVDFLEPNQTVNTSAMPN